MTSQSNRVGATDAALREVVYALGARILSQCESIELRQWRAGRCVVKIQDAISSLEGKPEDVAHILQAMVLLAQHLFDSNDTEEALRQLKHAAHIFMSHDHHGVTSGHHERASLEHSTEEAKAQLQIYILGTSWTNMLSTPSFLKALKGFSVNHWLNSNVRLIFVVYSTITRNILFTGDSAWPGIYHRSSPGR